MTKSRKFSSSGSASSADCVTFASYRHTKYDLNGDAQLSQTEFDSYNTDFGGSGESIKELFFTSVGTDAHANKMGFCFLIACERKMSGVLPSNLLLMKYL